MFNDMDKRLKITAVINLVTGLFAAWFTASFTKVVTEFDGKGRAIKFYPQSNITVICVIVAVLTVIVSVLSFVIAAALSKKNYKPFAWLKGAAPVLRVLGWIMLVGGGAGAALFGFWAFLNVQSDNSFVSAVSYGILILIPLAGMVYGTACFLYGLGNAADGGGDAKYVKDSKLSDMDDIHEGDTRAICPDCGTRTDRKTCPNCGATIRK